MSLPRVYAVSESERIGETLAVLLEPTCDYRWLALSGSEPAPRLPRPALLIDARTPAGCRAERPTEWLQQWPGIPTLRINLLAQGDPLATQQAVTAALRQRHETPDLATTIRVAVARVHADLKPRLVAARVLLAIACRETEVTRHTAWRSLCREQLLAIVECVAALGAQPPTQ